MAFTYVSTFQPWAMAEMSVKAMNKLNGKINENTCKSHRS